MNGSGRPDNSSRGQSANGRTTAPARGFALWALVVANSGVLLVLLFGPNANHPVAPLAYGGAALAIGGFLLTVRSLIARRRNEPFPPTKAV